MLFGHILQNLVLVEEVGGFVEGRFILHCICNETVENGVIEFGPFLLFQLLLQFLDFPVQLELLFFGFLLLELDECFVLLVGDFGPIVEDLVHVLDGVGAVEDYLLGLLDVLQELLVLFAEGEVLLVDCEVHELISQRLHEVLQVVDVLEPIPRLELPDAHLLAVDQTLDEPQNEQV